MFLYKFVIWKHEFQLDVWTTIWFYFLSERQREVDLFAIDIVLQLFTTTNEKKSVSEKLLVVYSEFDEWNRLVLAI